VSLNNTIQVPSQPHIGEVTISCIILTWNSSVYIERCIDSVFVELDKSGVVYEVFIIDNGSTDRTLEFLALMARPELTVVPLGHNTGTTFSRNIGLRMARGKYIAIMDSDIEMTRPDTFERLVHYLDQNSDVGIVAPQLKFPSERFQKTVDIFPTLTHKIHRFLRLRAIEESEASHLAKSSERRDVDYAVSAFWLIPKAVIKRLGMLDENIFYTPEDVDYCLRCWLSGYRVVYMPGITATHHAQEISRRSVFSRSFREHLKGLVYLYWKYKFVFRLDAIYDRIDAARQEKRTISCPD
jgi:GT2 family glycosyltransferase